MLRKKRLFDKVIYKHLQLNQIEHNSFFHYFKLLLINFRFEQSIFVLHRKYCRKMCTKLIARINVDNTACKWANI